MHQSSWGNVDAFRQNTGARRQRAPAAALAPIQVVVVPIWKKDEEKEQVMASVDSIISFQRCGRSHASRRRRSKSPVGGCQYEMGVPVAIEVGPKDVAKGACVVARRDIPGKQGKEFGGA